MPAHKQKTQLRIGYEESKNERVHPWASEIAVMLGITGNLVKERKA